MRLLSLHLDQFRNHRSLGLELGGVDVHLFAGPNGSGKTNILESVTVLSLSKSFLGADDEHLRTWGTEFYRVRGVACTDAGEERSVEVVSQILPRKQKACFVNDVRSPVSQLVGSLPFVAFLPQDLSLFSGPPAERRRFIDQILCQVSSEYFVSLLEYQKILKQRNTLLRHVADGRQDADSLDSWDEELSKRGSVVTLLRLELMETFTLALGEEVRSLGERWSSAGVSYTRSGTARERGELERELQMLLRDTRSRDVLLQSTGIGPHRDDWHLTADGRPLPSFASRGQQRVGVLALLFLEASYLELRTGEKPIILLDDIYSELDDAHRERVTGSFAGHQVLMTGTHVPEGFMGKVWEVKDGTPVAVPSSGAPAPR